jgi:hypothetical protein
MEKAFTFVRRKLPKKRYIHIMKMKMDEFSGKI